MRWICTCHPPSDALVIPSAHEPNFQITLPNRLFTRETWVPGELHGFQLFQERFAAGLKVNGAVGPFWNELIPTKQ
jgi:hypothetical protein